MKGRIFLYGLLYSKFMATIEKEKKFLYPYDPKETNLMVSTFATEIMSLLLKGCGPLPLISTPFK
jgi:hypothetical protein